MAIRAGNKGEWSELYTLGYLLTHGGGYAADAKQGRIRGSFHRVQEIFVDGLQPNGFRAYRIGKDLVEILDDSTIIAIVEKEEIGKLINDLLDELTLKLNSKTFPLESGSQLMSLLERDRIAASSNQKTYDLELILLGQQADIPSPRVGFSVKSQLGSPSTLLNASRATNLTFQLRGHSTQLELDLKELSGKGGKALFSSIRNLGYSLELEGFDNKQFEKNLEKIDSRLPIHLAKIVEEFYFGGESLLVDLAREVFPPGDETSEQPVFKLKQLLGAVAMGMRPSQSWDGDITKFKGMILVKSDGDVLFYYLYNVSAFQEFLFENVKLEQASNARHNFGRVFEEDGVLKIKLNLQIRFAK